MTSLPVPAPLSSAGLPPGNDPFVKIGQKNLPEVSKYWREQQVYAMAILARLPAEDALDAIRSRVPEQGFQSVVAMNADAAYFSERGTDNRARIVRREFETGKESVVWMARDQRWPVKINLSSDKKRVAVLLSGINADVLLITVSEPDAEPVTLKDADVRTAMLWVNGGSSFVYQPRRDSRLSQELHFIQLEKNDRVPKVIKRWDYHQDSKVTVVASQSSKSTLTWVESDAEGQILHMHSASIGALEKNTPVWSRQKVPAGKILRLQADQSTFLVLENGQRQVWEVSGTPRKVWQDELTKTPLVYAVDGKNFWINDASGAMVRISAEGKKTQKLSLPDAYKPDLALPVNDGVAVFAHNKDGAAGWVFLQDGRSPEWLQLPSVSTDVFMSEWRGRQVWQKHKTAGMRILAASGLELDGKQPVLLTTQIIADADMPPVWRGWLKKGGVIAQLDLRKVSSVATLSVMDEAVEWLKHEGFGASGVVIYAVSDQQLVMEYLLRMPGKITAAYVNGLPDTRLQTGKVAGAGKSRETARGDLYDLLRRETAYPGLWLDSAGAVDASEHLKLVGAMQLLTKGVRPQFWTQGALAEQSSENTQAGILAFLLWQTGGLSLKSVPPARK